MTILYSLGKFSLVVSLENQDLVSGSGPRGPLQGSTTSSNFDSPGVIWKEILPKCNFSCLELQQSSQSEIGPIWLVLVFKCSNVMSIGFCGKTDPDKN